MYLIIVILQAILHYLGITGIILGIIAYLFGNKTRCWELLIGGISFIVLKYIVGIIYLLARAIRAKVFHRERLGR
jgi:hydrogenase-4 membrane subunit HyfE